jgi:tetratricopeptide (TPR) repeat protein
LAAGQAPPSAAPALRTPAPGPAPAQRARQAVAEAAADEEDGQIMVTGSRVERGDFAARAPITAVADLAPLDGEWNACTLHDPRRNPTVCRDSAEINDGLALAWQGDLDRAIRSFDRAIAAEPDLALAYLNRGLAWQEKGDLARALADLNRAVARDRTGARAYYHRSLLYRARGDAARAEADAKRAVELDQDYEAVLP